MAKKKRQFAISIAEVIVAMSFLAVISIGAMGYQFHGRQQSKLARWQQAATRTAQLLIEDWKSSGGSGAYNPASLGLGFTSETIPGDFTEGQGLGNVLHNCIYTHTIDDVDVEVMLCWMDVEEDSFMQLRLRRISCIVKYGGDRTTNPVTFTTYVRGDMAGG